MQSHHHSWQGCSEEGTPEDSPVSQFHGSSYNSCDRASHPRQPIGGRAGIDAGQRLPARIATYSDHRIAMSFALAGLMIEGIVKAPDAIANPYGLRALWAQGDWVARVTLLVLVVAYLGLCGVGAFLRGENWAWDPAWPAGAGADHAAASSATPRAWPSFSALRTFLA